MPPDRSSPPRNALGRHPLGLCRQPGFEALEDRRMLVVAISGADNDDAASLLSYGGPGDPASPGFANLGRSSNGVASVVYLGDGWVLTANHVGISTPVGFGDDLYAVDTSTIHRLHNPDSSLADLKMFKIIGDPGLPAIAPHHIASAPPAVDSHVFMMGNGLTPGDEHFWSVDTGQFPWVWTETSEPPVPGTNDMAGFDVLSTRRTRWGENEIESNNLFLASVWGYITQLDDDAYTGTPALTHEAQATSGDSGGPVFTLVDGEWMLSGIMIAVSSSLSGQPSSTTLYGFQTLSADLSFYRDEIYEVMGVVDRQVFYNNSAFDGQTPEPHYFDDSAIATDKVAYRPGDGVAGPQHATSYSRGINGIMVDLGSDHGTLTLDDFQFRMGANNAPSTWTAAPAPSGFLVRPNTGGGGTDRIHITWDDGAIINTWLEVTVKGNDAVGGFNLNTGLAASDVFYFGNLVGDTFVDSPANVFLTSSADEVEIESQVISTADVTSAWDMDRNGIHLSSDRIVTRSNTIAALTRIDISDPPAAPAPAVAEPGPSAVAAALVETDRPRDVSPDLLPDSAAPASPGTNVERFFAQLTRLDPGQWLVASDEELGQDNPPEALWIDVAAKLWGIDRPDRAAD